MFDTFVRFWKIENNYWEIREWPVDLVIPICYTTRRDRLTLATELNFQIALGYLKIFPEATLAFGNWPCGFQGAERVESELKYVLLPLLDSIKFLEVSILNSVDEAEKIRKATKDAGIEPRRILIVTGELHSRSVRFIYERVFPQAKILITCIHYRNEVEPGHIVRVQRTLWKWIPANLVRHALLRTVGMSAIRNLRHRAVH